MKTKFLSLLLIATIITSCKKEADTDNPVASIDNPASGEAIYTNDGLRLVATLSDNTGLLQYKLTLSGIDSLNDVGADSTISMIFVDGIPDGNKAFYIDQVIPLHDSTFNGHYQVTLSCLDVEGNESLRDTVNFEIRNSIDFQPPIIDVGGPLSDTLTYGQGFSPFGSIMDSQSLIYATIYMGKVDGTDTLHWFDFPVVQDNSIVFGAEQAWWAVDSTWAKGDYHIYCTAWDNYSGVSASVPFYVSY